MLILIVIVCVTNIPSTHVSSQAILGELSDWKSNLFGLFEGILKSELDIRISNLSYK